MMNKSDEITTEELIGSFKWFVSSMLTLKEHLAFESAQGDYEIVLKYNSKSQSAALAL